MLLLAIMDLARTALDPSSLSIGWFSVSLGVGAVVLGVVTVLSHGKSRRVLIDRMIRHLAFSSSVSRPGRAEKRRALFAAVLGASVLLGLGCLALPRLPHTPMGDDEKPASAAMGWHDAFAGEDSDSPGMPAEPKPTWVLAGLLSDGTMAGALHWSRIIALVCGVLAVLMASVPAGLRAGAGAALASSFALVIVPNVIMKSTYASEDTALMLFSGASLMIILHSVDRPRLWPLAGLMAGLAATCKLNGLFPLGVLVAALVWNKRVTRRSWPWLAGAVAAALVCMIPLAVHMLGTDEPTRDTELLGLMMLHGPAITRAKATGQIPEFPGWGMILVHTLGIMRLGDLLTGAFINFKPMQAWILPAILFPALASSDPTRSRVLWSLLIVGLGLLGVVGWKTGDAAEPCLLMGPPAAYLLGIHWPDLMNTLRRRIWARLIAVLLAFLALVEIAFRFQAPPY